MSLQCTAFVFDSLIQDFNLRFQLGDFSNRYTRLVANPLVLVQGEITLWTDCPRGASQLSVCSRGGSLWSASLVESDFPQKAGESL